MVYKCMAYTCEHGRRLAESNTQRSARTHFIRYKNKV